jgi:hypothetical protein
MQFDDEIIVVKPHGFKCVLSAEETEQMIARGVSFGGLGMYVTMCEYEPDTLFTLDMLMGEANNTREEVEEILNELLNAAYVFRTDEQIEGIAAFVVNRDLLPESISETT